MDEFKKNILALGVRSFVPLNPFYINYMVDSKGFSSIEMSNQIGPFYFYSSFLGIFFCKNILHSIGTAYSSVFVSGTYLLNMIALLNIPMRSFLGGRMVYFISGFVSSFDSVLRFYISETSNETKSTGEVYAYLSLMRALSGTFSCFVGQEIAMRTGHLEFNVHISIFTQFIGFCISLLTAINSDKKVEFVDINSFKAVASMDKALLSVFLASCMANCFNLFIKVFSQSIFRDKEVSNKTVTDSFVKDKQVGSEESSKSTEIHENSLSYAKLASRRDVIWMKIENLVKLPVAIVSVFFIKVLTFIFPKYKIQGNVKRSFLNGNVDAFINLLCHACSFLLIKIESKEVLYLPLLLISSVCLLIITKIKNRVISSILYLAIATSANACNQVSKSLLKKNKNDNNLVVASFIFEAIVNNAISQGCKVSKANSVVKSRIYSLIGLAISILLIAMKIF